MMIVVGSGGRTSLRNTIQMFIILNHQRFYFSIQIPFTLTRTPPYLFWSDAIATIQDRNNKTESTDVSKVELMIPLTSSYQLSYSLCALRSANPIRSELSTVFMYCIRFRWTARAIRVDYIACAWVGILGRERCCLCILLYGISHCLSVCVWHWTINL